jgi:hypothetical protein
MKDFTFIDNGKSAGVGFMGKFSNEHKYKSVLDHVNKGYSKHEGIRWRKGNKFYHSEDIPIYNEEQTRQILKYGMIVEGRKKPYGKKRVLTVYTDGKKGFETFTVIKGKRVLN